MAETYRITLMNPRSNGRAELGVTLDLDADDATDLHGRLIIERLDILMFDENGRSHMGLKQPTTIDFRLNSDLAMTGSETGIMASEDWLRVEGEAGFDFDIPNIAVGEPLTDYLLCLLRRFGLDLARAIIACREEGARTVREILRCLKRKGWDIALTLLRALIRCLISLVPGGGLATI